MYPIIEDLNGTWSMRMTEHDTGDPQELNMAKDGWLAAAVPGDVHEALMQAGLIADVHIDDNAVHSQWVSRKDWWFRRSFIAPRHLGGYTELQMDGLDVYAMVWLNGHLLGTSENAFLPWRARVDEVLKPGEENVILVRLESIAEHLGRTRFTGWPGDWDAPAILRAKVRKPQFSFGWDWAPVMPSIGIWRPVRLVSWAEHRITDVHVRTDINGQVDIFVTMNRQLNEGRLEIRVNGPGYTAQQVMPLHCVRHYCSFSVTSPALWWPAGYGRPHLYEYEVVYKNGDEICDIRRGRFGIREVRIWEEPYSGGMSFGLQVNGVKVFCKGSNWIPVELFPGTAKRGRILAALDKAAEAHFNMVRVWGGGIYEDDCFYDWCDENGVMVWQDFMFSSAAYDVTDPAFRRSVITEAEYQVKRLRNHPSVVLWCGTNEDVRSWWGSRDDQNDDTIHDKYAGIAARLRLDDELFSMILRGTVNRFTREPYVESSPQSLNDFGNHPASGNSHLSVHKYCFNKSAAEYRSYFDTIVAFDSEFCIQGPPRASSLRRFFSREHWWPPDQIWNYHINKGHGRLHHEMHIRYAEELFGPVDSLETYCKYGAAMHAEFMRAEYESARRYKWACGGTMVWMHNDCWPTANWSLFDYYHVAKPAFYAAKRACAHVAPIIFPRHDLLQFYMANDTLAGRSGEAVIGQETLHGEVLWQKRLAVVAPANASVCFHSMPQSDLVPDENSVIFADITLEDETLERVVYFPFLWKNVKWPNPHIGLELLDQTTAAGQVITTIRVSTDTFARMCHLDILPLSDHTLSDNFFDLCAGRSRVVEVVSPRHIGLAEISVGHWLTEWR